MSGWDDFCASVSRLAERAAEATSDLADTAALKLRLSEAEKDEALAFEGLGRLMYTRLRKGGDNTADIEVVMTRVDALEKQIAQLRQQLDAKKAARAGADTAEESCGDAAGEPTDGGEQADTGEPDMKTE